MITDKNIKYHYKLVSDNTGIQQDKEYKLDTQMQNHINIARLTDFIL